MTCKCKSLTPSFTELSKNSWMTVKMAAALIGFVTIPETFRKMCLDIHYYV